MTLSEQLEGTEFELQLAGALLKFMPQHIKASMDNPDNKYSEYGTINEVKLKTILGYFTNLYTILNDLDLTLQFLNKERKLILEHYPSLNSQRTYYNYHYENYFIRIATLNDIVGRLGTLVYGLDIELKKSSSYIFKDKARREGYEQISLIVEKLIERLEYFKEERHKKLHTGEVDSNSLNGVVIWQDLMKKIGSDSIEILEEYTNNEIELEVEKLNENAIEITKIIKEFLEESTEKLKEINANI